jgi:hypothetical protein
MSTPAATITAPEIFVAEAERASNEYDFSALTGVYAETAEFEAVMDGVRESHDGIDAIHRAWRMYLPPMRSGGLQLRKELLSATDDGLLITNLWRGELRHHRSACGIEHWERDEQGRVVRHRMWSYLSVQPVDSLRGRLRLLALYPRLALAFDRARRTAR